MLLESAIRVEDSPLVQHDLAKKVNLSGSMIFSTRRGARRANPQLEKEIARAFHMPPEIPFAPRLDQPETKGGE